jgi:hypothetical protein
LAFGENLTYSVRVVWPMHGVILSVKFELSSPFTPHPCGCGVASRFFIACSMLLDCFRSGFR